MHTDKKLNAETQRTRRFAEDKFSALLCGLCVSAFSPIRVYPCPSVVEK